jgi:hypothetical protein
MDGIASRETSRHQSKARSDLGVPLPSQANTRSAFLYMSSIIATWWLLSSACDWSIQIASIHNDRVRVVCRSLLRASWQFLVTGRVTGPKYMMQAGLCLSSPQTYERASYLWPASREISRRTPWMGFGEEDGAGWRSKIRILCPVDFVRWCW